VRKSGESIGAQEDKFQYYLYNILTDEMLEIKCELPKLIKMVEFLIYSKYFHKHVVSDEKFMSSIMALKMISP
jgi:hypothetical protein